MAHKKRGHQMVHIALLFLINRLTFKLFSAYSGSKSKSMHINRFIHSRPQYLQLFSEFDTGDQVAPAICLCLHRTVWSVFFFNYFCFSSSLLSRVPHLRQHPVSPLLASRPRSSLPALILSATRMFPSLSFRCLRSLHHASSRYSFFSWLAFLNHDQEMTR
jgi:hypothetical protein